MPFEYNAVVSLKSKLSYKQEINYEFDDTFISTLIS